MNQLFYFKSKFTILDFILELLALVALLFILVFTIYIYPKLPDIIPTHINYKGMADEYGNKTYFFLLPSLAVVIYALIMFLNRDRFLLSSVDTIFGNNPEQTYILTKRLMRFLKLSILLLFIFSILYDVSLMRLIRIRLPAYYIWIGVLILLILPIALFFLAIAKQKKPE